MTNYIISVYTFFLIFAIAYFLPKYNDILFMVQLDKTLSQKEPFFGIVCRFRERCFSCAVLLCAICPTLESIIALHTPYFFISLGLSLYLFIIFALYLTSSREVLKERLSYSPENHICEKTEKKPLCEFYHYILHISILIKLIHFTLTLPYDYISISMLEYPVFTVITIILALIADRKFKKQSLIIYFTSLFIITAFSVIQQAFLSA